MKTIITIFLQLVYLLLIPVAWALSPILPFFVNTEKSSVCNEWGECNLVYILFLPFFLNWFMSSKDAPTMNENFNPIGRGYFFVLIWFIKNPANGFFVKYLQK